MNSKATGMNAERAEANASIDAIESILAANRSALNHTLSEIEQRTSIEGLSQEAMNWLGNGSGGELLRGLRDSMVRHPLPMALTALGLAWTAFSESNGRAGAADLGDARRETAGAAHRLDAAKARGREWAGRSREWAERSGEIMGNARERAGELGYSAAERTRRSMEQSRDLARDYPIITAGTGLALGAALAALLPSTQAERENLGPARDRTVRQARDAVAAARQGAKEGDSAAGPGSMATN